MCKKSRKFIIIYFSFCLCDIEDMCFMNLIVLMEICPLKVHGQGCVTGGGGGGGGGGDARGVGVGGGWK